MNFTQEELFKHMRIGHAVCTAEIALDLLAQHATELDPALAKRLLDAFQKYADARRALVSPLARAEPASDARN